MYLRIFVSSTRRSEKSCLLAYQWLSQSTMMPVRKPVGRIFCPMRSTPLAARWFVLRPDWFFQVRQRHADMRVTPFDLVRRAARPRHDAFHDRGPIHTRFHDDQIVDVTRPAILGVAQGAL